jgi:hypothetical protein
MANNNQTDAEYLVSCMFWKPLSEYTPTELKEYYEEKQAEIEFEEKKIAEAEDLDLEDE